LVIFLVRTLPSGRTQLLSLGSEKHHSYPKSVTPSRITENLKATELKLDAEDMQQLVELDRGYRYNKKEHWLLQGQDADELLWDVEEDRKFVVTSK